MFLSTKIVINNLTKPKATIFLTEHLDVTRLLSAITMFACRWYLYQILITVTTDYLTVPVVDKKCAVVASLGYE